MARPAPERLEVETGFVTGHATARDSLPGTARLGEARDVAIKVFAEDGLPHRRIEDYRYFDLRQMLGKTGPLALAPQSSASGLATEDDPFAGVERVRVVLVNGRIDQDASALDGLPEGVELLSFADAAEQGTQWLEDAMADQDGTRDAVAALNLAYASDGVALRVAKGVTVNRPIELAWRSTGETNTHYHARSVVVLEEGASLTLLETRSDETTTPVFATQSLTLRVADKARLTHAAIYADGEAAVRVANKRVTLGTGTTYKTLGLAIGEGRARTSERVHFNGEETKASINGLTLLKGKAVMDNTLFVDHAVPNCDSEETYRYVLDETARGVFQGSILVREHAQKIDSQMQARALLMSRKAEMDAKPMLEIYADDVQCAHGSAIGEPDQDAIFYLMSRGIDEPTARALLIAGFLDDVVDGFDDGDVAAALKHLLAQRLGAPDPAEDAIGEDAS
ncbi:Fe-S cluster assembly protein SufD [Pyruvatibacter mobilis]|uniref:Fe-S cluster assembly protein SufD n=1 Tax=Pyruvatibacter mobilis TaxID=1712261 RepID=UPI003D10360F